MKLTAWARGKINLAIDVLNRQDDGYHQVAMVLQSISLSDRLTFELCQEGIELQCSDPGLSCHEDNLVVKAAYTLHKLAQRCKPRGVRIYLEKNIPMAAGLAGGSSDAAATLLALNKLWGLSLSRRDLSALGLGLGADVPFCLQGGTMLARGVGEVLTPLPPLSPLPLVLVKPNFSISTASVYKSLNLANIRQRPDIELLVQTLKQGDMEGVYGCMGNVLEQGVGDDHYQTIALLKERLRLAGARGELMSGSGPTVFGFFAEPERALEVARIFRGEGFWSVCSSTCSTGILVEG